MGRICCLVQVQEPGQAAAAEGKAVEGIRKLSSTFHKVSRTFTVFGVLLIPESQPSPTMGKRA